MSPLLLHVDGVAGISGDMTLGALLDLGVSVEQLRAGLATLPLVGWTLTSEDVVLRGFAAKRANVSVDGARVSHEHGHHQGHDHQHQHDEEHGRTFNDLAHLIEHSKLSPRVKRSAVAVFRRLCEAEAAVHGTTLENAHLHEAGAVDALIDVCGACLGLELLGWPEVSASAPDIGGGSVRCKHGLLPVPAPATAKLLEGLPTTSSGLEFELVTPTGAALLATLVTSWGTRPPMRVLRTGLGAGTQDLPDRANVVRFSLGEALLAAMSADDGAALPSDAGVDSPVSARVVIEADVDDADPQMLAAFCERARELGASDVTQLSVVMKKGRVGTRLGIVCPESSREHVIDALFAETTTIGCRWHEAHRAECERSVVSVSTPHGSIRIKVARWNGRIVNRKPEHEDCLAASRRQGVPLKDVVLAAQAAAASLAPEDCPT